MTEKPTILLVNFGGPRSLGEIEPFLIELLTDKEVVRTRLPSLLHNYLFRKIAIKRAKKIAEDYKLIGGKSPIYQTTEAVAEHLRQNTEQTVYTFHRYLPATHLNTIQLIEKTEKSQIIVLPLFPQFSYATTGSIATFFFKRLRRQSIQKLRWIKSYPSHFAFISAWCATIQSHLQEQGLLEKETFFLFSAHGIPRSFVDSGYPYEVECGASYRAILQQFPHALGKLTYQSKFGPGEWLRPYTNETCDDIKKWTENRTAVLFIPLAFTSDHIETLFEIEHLYMPLITAQGLKVSRCPALNLSEEWLKSLEAILQEPNLTTTQMLLRQK